MILRPYLLPLALFGSLLSPPETAAQSATRGFCLMSSPAPHCRSFLTADLTLAAHLGGSDYPSWNAPTEREHNAMDRVIGWNVGAMVNVDPEFAGGISATVAADGRYGVELQARRWVGGIGAVDLTAGYIQANRKVHPREGAGTVLVMQERARGITASANLGFPNLGGGQIRSDYLWSEAGPVWAVYGGANIGAIPGLILTGLYLFVGALSST